MCIRDSWSPERSGGWNSEPPSGRCLDSAHARRSGPMAPAAHRTRSCPAWGEHRSVELLESGGGRAGPEHGVH
eukprot:8690276-Alexandrium_andersonii.AAC.1